MQMDMDRRKILSRVGWALFLMVLCNLAAQLILATISIEFFPKFYDSTYYGVVVTFLSVAGAGYPVFLAVIRRIPDTAGSQEGPVKLSFGQLLGVFFVCTSFMYISSTAGSLIGMLISGFKGSEIINPVEEFLENSNIFVQAIYTVLLGPIMEEYVFRKVLLNKVKRFGDLPAIMITAVAFGLTHLNLSQFIYGTTLGILFAYIALRTNTIRYTIIIHIMINLIGSVIAPFSLGNRSAEAVLSLWVIVSIIVGIVIFKRNRKGILLLKGEEPVEKKSEYFLHVSAILYLMLCLAIVVLQILR